MGNTLVPPPNKTKQPQTWQPSDPNRPIKSAIKQPKGTKDTKQTKENKENVENEQQDDDGYMVEPVRDNPGVFVGNPRTRPNYTNHTPRATRSLPVPYPQNGYRVFPRQRPNRYSEIPSDDEFRPNVPVRRFINTPLPRPLVTRAARIPTVYPIPYQREPTAFYHRHSYGAPYSYNNYSTYPQYNQPRASDVIHHTYSVPTIPYNNPRPVTVLASARPPRTPYHQEPVVHVHHQHSAPLEEYVPIGYDHMGYEPIVYRSTTPAIVEHQTPAELRTMTRVGGVKVIMVKSRNSDRKQSHVSNETNPGNDKDLNIMFYTNQIKFRPEGEYVDYILKYWYGNYHLLDTNKSYIPWLFPTSNTSKTDDFLPPALRPHEAKFISTDPEARLRYTLCYKMMLDFYGFHLQDETTGQLVKTDNSTERLYHLNRSEQHQRHITQISQSLGDVGVPHYQGPFIMCLFHEVFETKTLSAVPSKLLLSWLNTVQSEFERDYIYREFYSWLHTMGKFHVLETKAITDRTLYEKLQTFDRTLQQTYSAR